jgi:hypothetical protein
MTWAMRRRSLLIAVLILCAAAFIAIVVVAFTYQAPSCMDHKQDQGEDGVDCGGPCPYLCAVDEAAPRVTFVRPVSPQVGRTDIIAYIDNENPDAGAVGASYTLELYNSDGTVLATHSGSINLPPGTTVPLYLSDVYTGREVVTQAFLSIDPTSLKWQQTDVRPILPIPSNIQIQNTQTPKITATLTNPVAREFDEETVVATVFDQSNNAIGASQTVIPILAPQGTAQITFTWNRPFSGTPVRVEILPAASAAPSL